MRNLKKFLALVLAMMMTFSLMVTVNAANSDFTDSEDIDPMFEEAVEVLSSIGIFQGTEENGVLEFAPKASVTRAQMAAVVYRLATGDAKDEKAHLYKEYQSFSDVSGDDWYAGYVGFCADAEIIAGYPDGSFKPGKAVTGYEALKMLLCAVGWGQNGEFEGSGWTIRVGSTATGEGLLKNVNNSSYSNTLNNTALREMLAEVTFQAAQVPTVIYRYGTYEKTQSLVSSVLNPSLGEKFFGLDSYTGIIVGNQQTGEDYTLLSMSMNKDGSIKGVSYAHETDTDLTSDNDDYTDDALVLTFDTETGVDLFGHKVKIWFDNRTNGAKETVKVSSTASVTHDTEFGKIYTVMNKSSKTAVISSSSVATDKNALKDSADGDKKYMGTVAAGKDFVVDETNGAYNSDAFAVIADKDTTIPVAKSGATNLFLLISNSEPNSKGKCALDVVVSLGVQVQTITKTNVFDNKNTVTVTAADAGPTDTVIGTKDAFDSTNGYKNILVYGKDDIKVGSYVVTNKIYGTSADLYGDGADGDCYLWGINALTETESGIITGIAGDGKVTLSGGQTLEMSPLFEVGVAATAASSTATMNTARKNNDLLIGSNMTFTLDKDGKYVGAKPATETYIYADYAYYVQNGIDSFSYYLKGVGLDGNELTVEIDKDSYDDINVAHDSAVIRVMSSNTAVGTANVTVPSTAYSLMHELFVVDGLKQAAACTGATALTAAYTEAPNTFKLTGDSSDSITLTADTKYLDGSTPLAYITDETQFHVLTGWGSTMKVEHYTGLKELLGDATSYNVQGIYTLGSIDTEHTGAANSGISHMIIINGKKVANGAFLYVATEPTTGSGMTKDYLADQFALYKSGESTKTNLLVLAKTSDAANQGAGHVIFDFDGGHHFYDYDITEKGYYELKDLNGANDGNDADSVKEDWYVNEDAGFEKAGSKMGYLQTNATIDGTIKVTDDTKIIDITDPSNGIDSYAKLSQAIEENIVKADILQTAEGSGVASIIYVYSVAQRPA